MKTAYLRAIDYYLPARVLDNEEISNNYPELGIDKIAAKTGIYTRHIAAVDEFSSDMAVNAAEALFANNDIDKANIDYLLFCTQSPDYFLPTTACILQQRLNLPKHIGAIDYNLGCSGFVYGLGLAKGLILSGQAKNVLLVTSETYSKFLHAKDHKNKSLFGDAAAAALVSCKKDEGELAAEILNFVYGTDGAGANNLIVKNGGMRNRHAHGTDVEDKTGFVYNDDYLFMDGGAIFNFTAFNIPRQITDVLQRNNLGLDDIDLFVLHQANRFMLDAIRKRAGIPQEKFYIYLQNCGNTVSSTIPIALHNAVKEERIQLNNKVLISGFGVGFSMASAILQY